MIGGVLVGAGIGYLCQRFLGWSKISFAVFLILGGIAGILNIYRFLKKEDKPDA
jgi:F0F1-type ATP synthase assembly protein I